MSEIWMDVDTALATVPVNIMPLIDDTDFKSIEDGVVFNQAGLALFWNFTTTAGVTTVTAVTPTTAGDYDWTDFTTSGMYGIEIPASGGASANNDTEGFGHFTGVATGILPWRGPVIGFRAAALNDALIDGGDNLIVDLNTTQPAVTFASITSTGAFTISDGIIVTASTTNRDGISIAGNGDGIGMLIASTASPAVQLLGGTNSPGLESAGNGFAPGGQFTGGVSGNGITASSGATSGDGIQAVALGSGVDIRGDITGDLSGSVGSVTGNVDLNADQSTVTIGTVTTNTDMRGTDGANTVVPPSVAQFNARTLLAASYFDPAADAVANVTLVATTTTNTDMRGTENAALASAVAALNDLSSADVLTTALTEAYNADGVEFTLSEALYLIVAYLMERGVSSTTVTAKQLDGSTTAATFTLNDAVNPTSVTRAS